MPANDGTAVARPESQVSLTPCGRFAPVRRQASAYKEGIIQRYGLATCHTSFMPSPVMSPAFLSLTKVYSGLPS